MATLDTSLGWVAGDVERILLALEIGISSYTIHEMTVGCNELGSIASTQVSNVRSLLSEWDDALADQKAVGGKDEAGKTLVKADVLEWEVNGSRYDGILKEKSRIYNELRKIFSFVSIVGVGGGSLGVSLYRS
tara:strand:- start:27 stop:425 length:399 start_codon:yes stop_codon:yes gene_type:complete